MFHAPLIKSSKHSYSHVVDNVSVCMSVAGPIGGMLTNRFGHRLIAMIGALFATVGLALGAFGSNVYLSLIHI